MRYGPVTHDWQFDISAAPSHGQPWQSNTAWQFSMEEAEMPVAAWGLDQSYTMLYRRLIVSGSTGSDRHTTTGSRSTPGYMKGENLAVRKVHRIIQVWISFHCRCIFRVLHCKEKGEVEGSVDPLWSVLKWLQEEPIGIGYGVSSPCQG